MNSSATEVASTVVSVWEPDLVDEVSSLVYRHGEESNNNDKDTECVASAMLVLAIVEQPAYKPHIEGTAPSFLEKIS